MALCRILARTGATGALVALAAGVALAQTADDARKKLETNRIKLEETKRRAGDIQTDVQTLKDEREKLNSRLVETAKLIQSSEAQLTTIEQRLGELEAQEKLVRGSLEQRHGSISGLLAAMQRMGRNPPPVMITRREDALAMVRSAMLLAAAFPELRGQALILTEQLNDLMRVMTNIRNEGERLRTETQRLADARLRLAQLMETKKQTINDRQDELKQVRAAAAEITRSVSDLSELITRLDKTVEEKTALGAYQKQAEVRQAAAEPVILPTPAPPAAPPPVVAVAPAAPQPKAPIVPKADARVALELAPTGDRLAMAAPGRIKPAIPFQLARGQLPLPAQGRRVISFGDKTQYGTQSKGLVLETRHGAQITAPADGWIVFAGEFRTYGQLLIINAGGGYHILLAGLSQIDVQLGQFVLAGEPVGSMVQTARGAQPRQQDSAPVLYVEFRKDGQPVNPDPWWVDGSRKVQG
jgi:septal ring factor EnvC (AmiA/AmiB activator)